MDKLMHNLFLQIIKLLDVILITIPFALCWHFYYASRTAAPFFYKGNVLLVVLFVCVFYVFTRVYDALVISINRVSEMFYSQALAILISDGILFIVLWLLNKSFPNILPALAAFAAQMLFSFAWCVFSRRWYYSTYPARRTIIVYDYRQGMENIIHEYGMDKKFEILSTVSVTHCVADLTVLDEMETVFLSGVRSHERNIILKYCVERGIEVYVIPRVGDIIMSSAKKIHMLHLPVLQIRRFDPAPEYVLFKRLLDIVFSGLALIISSPVSLVTAIAIKATDGGPVFYKQVRLTKDRKEFQILKFRSMRIDAEKDGVARLSTGANDDRITPVGRVIRKVRIDELPQLINILKGDMSIVGPRPERPEIAAEYEEILPEFSLRLQVKAGLTGYAQIYGKYNTTPYDKLQMDLSYIASASIVEDLRIMFATVKILFLPESTEGVAQGATTAMDYEKPLDSADNEAETVKN